ncbi:MAG: hypothetical protein IPM16_05570 [Chloroflexi bacterium]|nr:hypothetical protein [Chloroflexota bacterium]
MIETKIHDIIGKFREYSEHARVVILQPDSKYRTALTAALLNDSDLTTLYVPFSSETFDEVTLFDRIVDSLSAQTSSFGIHASAANAMIGKNMGAFRKAAIEGLLKDFEQVEGDRIVLILDDYDFAAATDSTIRFLEELIVKFPDRYITVFNGRSQPRFPWVSLIAQTRAIILDDDRVVTQAVQHSPEAPTGRLDIFALGPGFVFFNDELITDWEGHLPRLLLFFAVDRGVITRDDFHRAFWGDLSDAQATNVFHVTKRRLHRAFDFEVLEHQNGTYRIKPSLLINYDAFEWTQALIRARDLSNEHPEVDYQRVLDLYRGPFLKGHDDHWILTRRQDIQAGYLEAVRFLAERFEARYDADPNHNQSAIEKAVALYREALREVPESIELGADTAELLVRLGRRPEAVEVLAELEIRVPAAKRDPRVKAIVKAMKSV